MDCLKCNSSISDAERSIYGLHEKCFCDWFNMEVVSEFEDVARKQSASFQERGREFSAINSSFFHGKFKKYSAKLGNSEYILKVEENDYPELPIVEYVSNEIAGLLRIQVADFYFIDFHGLKTFVSRNFMSRSRRMNLQHIYKYLGEGVPFAVESILKLIEQQCGRIDDIERFAELCLFDAFIGNHDRHGRNLAFIEEKGRLRLSPFYDNPSYIGIESDKLLGAQHSPRGKIATSQTEEPTMKDYVYELQRLDLEYIVFDFHQRIDIEKIVKIVENSRMSEKRQQAFVRIMKERLEELNNELGL